MKEIFLYPWIVLQSDTAWLRCRVHERGFQSKRFHDQEIALKTTLFPRVYMEPIQPLNPTVYVKAISFSGLCAALRVRFTIFTSQARPFLKRSGFAVYKTNETISFWKRSTFESVLKTTRFW